MDPYRENAYKEDKKLGIEDIINFLCDIPPKDFEESVSKFITYETTGYGEIHVAGIYNDEMKIVVKIHNKPLMQKEYRKKDKNLYSKLYIKCEEVSSYFEQKMLNVLIKGQGIKDES